ncbi:hypothetical protein BpHYR1_034934 [Brachionus plicatilis]|uniref:Uncharacterized protein n=1 Tax=Brachionus plicatilis TaxID=10195 RepID=A0A3M7P9V6_BRAPC|nr:hypothetical protein BpHYR1_034934 [Brachionus plicatilis]
MTIHLVMQGQNYMRIRRIFCGIEQKNSIIFQILQLLLNSVLVLSEVEYQNDLQWFIKAEYFFSKSYSISHIFLSLKNFIKKN